jgi:hypothetical protein
MQGTTRNPVWMADKIADGWVNEKDEMLRHITV